MTKTNLTLLLQLVFACILIQLLLKAHSTLHVNSLIHVYSSILLGGDSSRLLAHIHYQPNIKKIRNGMRKIIPTRNEDTQHASALVTSLPLGRTFFFFFWNDVDLVPCCKCPHSFFFDSPFPTCPPDKSLLTGSRSFLNPKCYFIRSAELSNWDVECGRVWNVRQWLLNLSLGTDFHFTLQETLTY